MRRERKRGAFTVIELLIVVAIIGILAAIAVPNFLNAQVRAKVSRVQSDMHAMSVAVESYRLDENVYPPVGNCGVVDSIRWSEGWALAVLTTPIAYLASLPMDPFHPGDEIGHSTTGIHDNGLYWYMDRRTRGMGTCTPLSANRFFLNFAHMWATKSVGPNKVGDLNDPSAGTLGFVYLLYDMSNGLRSEGDVWRFGP